MNEAVSQTPRPEAITANRSADPSRTLTGRAVRWLLHAVPNVIVLALLAGLAWWGHSTGWTLPKFSQLNGTTAEKKGDWCAEHGVPESICIECRKDLVPKVKPFGWCRTHGVSECVNEHPELAQVQGTPKLPKYDQLVALTLFERPGNNSKCKLHERRLQFVSAEDVVKAGIDFEEVQERFMMEAKTANGEVGYDQTRVARQSSRVPGTASWVLKAVGDSVRQGEVLALIDAAEVGKVKSEYLQALAAHDQKTRVLENVDNLIRQGVYKEGSTQHVEARAAVRETETRVLTAQQALVNLGFPLPDNLPKLSPREQARAIQFLGLPQNLVQQMTHQGTSGNLIPIRAPFDGEVVERDVNVNQVVDSSKTLFVIADTSRMWLSLNVRLEDMRYVKVGQKILFRVGDQPKPAEGSVAWISTAVDEKTRTVTVRADLDNRDSSLRAHAFGTGQLVLREEKNAVAVPNEAVQWEGDCFVVFVRDKNYFKEGAPKFFHVRKVRPGAKDETHTELLAGVLPGEVVATKGSGVLRGELLKNNLGEG